MPVAASRGSARAWSERITAPGLVRGGSADGDPVRELGIAPRHRRCRGRCGPGRRDPAAGSVPPAASCGCRPRSGGPRRGCNRDGQRAVARRRRSPGRDAGRAGDRRCAHCPGRAPGSARRCPRSSAGVASRQARCASRRLMKLSSLLIAAMSVQIRLRLTRLSPQQHVGQAPCRGGSQPPTRVAAGARRRSVRRRPHRAGVAAIAILPPVAGWMASIATAARSAPGCGSGPWDGSRSATAPPSPGAPARRPSARTAGCPGEVSSTGSSPRIACASSAS